MKKISVTIIILSLCTVFLTVMLHTMIIDGADLPNGILQGLLQSIPVLCRIILNGFISLGALLSGRAGVYSATVAGCIIGTLTPLFLLSMVFYASTALTKK